MVYKKTNTTGAWNFSSFFLNNTDLYNKKSDHATFLITAIVSLLILLLKLEELKRTID